MAVRGAGHGTPGSAARRSATISTRSHDASSASGDAAHQAIAKLALTSQRYQLTPFGRGTAVLFTKSHGRVLAPGFALLETLVPDDIAQRSSLASAWRQLDLTRNDFIDRHLRAA